MNQSYCMVSEHQTIDNDCKNSSYDGIGEDDAAFSSGKDNLVLMDEAEKEFKEQCMFIQCDDMKEHDLQTVDLPDDLSLHSHLTLSPPPFIKSYDDRCLRMSINSFMAKKTEPLGSLDGQQNVERPTCGFKVFSPPRIRRPDLLTDRFSASDDGSFDSRDSQHVAEGIKKLEFIEVERTNSDVRHPVSSNPNDKYLQKNKVQPNGASRSNFGEMMTPKVLDFNVGSETGGVARVTGDAKVGSGDQPEVIRSKHGTTAVLKARDKLSQKSSSVSGGLAKAGELFSKSTQSPIEHTQTTSQATSSTEYYRKAGNPSVRETRRTGKHVNSQQSVVQGNEERIIFNESNFQPINPASSVKDMTDFKPPSSSTNTCGGVTAEKGPHWKSVKPDQMEQPWIGYSDELLRKSAEHELILKKIRSMAEKGELSSKFRSVLSPNGTDTRIHSVAGGSEKDGYALRPPINPNRHDSNKENMNPKCAVDSLPRTGLQSDKDRAGSNTGHKTGKGTQWKSSPKKQARTGNKNVYNRVTSDQSASSLKSPVYSSELGQRTQTAASVDVVPVTSSEQVSFSGSDVLPHLENISFATDQTTLSEVYYNLPCKIPVMPSVSQLEQTLVKTVHANDNKYGKNCCDQELTNQKKSSPRAVVNSVEPQTQSDIYAKHIQKFIFPESDADTFTSLTNVTAFTSDPSLWNNAPLRVGSEWSKSCPAEIQNHKNPCTVMVLTDDKSQQTYGKRDPKFHMEKPIPSNGFTFHVEQGTDIQRTQLTKPGSTNMSSKNLDAVSKTRATENDGLPLAAMKTAMSHAGDRDKISSYHLTTNKDKVHSISVQSGITTQRNPSVAPSMIPVRSPVSGLVQPIRLEPNVASTQAVMSPVQSQLYNYQYSKEECKNYILNKFLFGDADESSSTESQSPDFQNVHKSKCPSCVTPITQPRLVHSASATVLSGPETNVLVSPSRVNSKKVSSAKVSHSVKSSSSNLLRDQMKKYVQLAVERESTSDVGQAASSVLPGKSSSVTQLTPDNHFSEQNFQNSPCESRTGKVSSPSSSPSEVCSVVVPLEFRFHDICCIGLSTQDVLPINNPLEQWVRVGFKVARVTVNGKLMDDLMTCPFSLTDKCVIQPNSTANLKMKFAPRSAGVYVAQLQLRCSLSSSEEDDVFSSPSNKLPIMVTLQAVAEKPSVQITASGGGSSLYFDTIPWRYQTSRNISIINRGQANIPIRLVISTLSGTSCFSFEKVSDEQASKVPTRRHPVTSLIYGCTLPSMDTTGCLRPISVPIHFVAPDRHGAPAEEFLSRVFIEIDSVSAPFHLGTVELCGTAGTGKIHMPLNLQVVTLIAGEKESISVPLQNTGNIPVSLSLQVSLLSEMFEVSPKEVTMEPLQESFVTVKFKPATHLTDTGTEVQSFVLMMMKPEGPSYKIRLYGVNRSTLSPKHNLGDLPVRKSSDQSGVAHSSIDQPKRAGSNVSNIDQSNQRTIDPMKSQSDRNTNCCEKVQSREADGYQFKHSVTDKESTRSDIGSVDQTQGQSKQARTFDQTKGHAKSSSVLEPSVGQSKPYGVNGAAKNLSGQSYSSSNKELRRQDLTTPAAHHHRSDPHIFEQPERDVPVNPSSTSSEHRVDDVGISCAADCGISSRVDALGSVSVHGTKSSIYRKSGSWTEKFILNTTAVKNSAEHRLEIRNLSVYHLKWTITQFTSVYFKKPVESSCNRLTYSAFFLPLQSGLLHPKEAVKGIVYFGPREVGSYAQFWEVRFEASDSKEDLSHVFRIEFDADCVEEPSSADDVPTKEKCNCNKGETLSPMNSSVPHILCPDSNKVLSPVGSLVDSPNQNVLSIQPMEVNFPVTAVGKKRVVKVEIRNQDSTPYVLDISQPEAPFHTNYNMVKLDCHRYLHLPFQFLPNSAGFYRSSVLLRTCSGDAVHSFTVRLNGTCE